MRAARAAVMVTSLLLVGCSGDDDAADSAAKIVLTPSFTPDTASADSAVPRADATVTTGSNGATAVTPSTSSPGVGSAPGVAGASASTRDVAGDLTPSPLDRPPGWADLVAATLTRSGDRLALSIQLGEAAPSGAGDDDHTMNVATFYDLDGDGSIDREIWANLASGGWGAAVYGDGDARFGDDSGVAVTLEEGRVVLRFPIDHLGGATSFRWAVASEWGRYEVIGTVAAARDDMPDGDAAVRFPA